MPEHNADKDLVQIEGIIPLGTSLDYESERTRTLGCWDAPNLLTDNINEWTSKDKTPNFEPDDKFCNYLIDIGFGKTCDSSVRDYWKKSIKSNYQGDDGRRRIRMAAINLRDRDGLEGRLFDVKCPVMWLHVSIISKEGEKSFILTLCREPTTLYIPSPTRNEKSRCSRTRPTRS